MDRCQRESIKQKLTDAMPMPLRQTKAKILVGLLVAMVGIIDRSSALVVPRKDGISPRNQLPGADPTKTRRDVIASAAMLATTPALVSNAAMRDPKTGILLPSEGEIASAIPSEYSEDDNPAGKSFSRLDSASDGIFYSEPRFVEHVDAQAVQSMTQYISSLLKPGDSVLDLCSSWTSHIDPDIAKSLKRVAGLGMNAEELKANTVLTDWTVQDLNSNMNAKLPYEDGSFDVVLIQLSIDYLLYPVEIASELFRVLAKGGKVAILYSNRLFIQKAVGWWSGSDDFDRTYVVGSYLYFGGFPVSGIKAEDLSRRKKGKERLIDGDPLYVVTGTKT